MQLNYSPYQKCKRMFILRRIPMSLLLFLIKEKALSRFVDNTIKQFDVILKNNPFEMRHLCSLLITPCLCDKFYWKTTPQGYDYWWRLEKKVVTQTGFGTPTPQPNNN